MQALIGGLIIGVPLWAWMLILARKDTKQRRAELRRKNHEHFVPVVEDYEQ